MHHIFVFTWLFRLYDKRLERADFVFLVLFWCKHICEAKRRERSKRLTFFVPEFASLFGEKSRRERVRWWLYNDWAKGATESGSRAAALFWIVNFELEIGKVRLRNSTCEYTWLWSHAGAHHNSGFRVHVWVGSSDRKFLLRVNGCNREAPFPMHRLLVVFCLDRSWNNRERSLG